MLTAGDEFGRTQGGNNNAYAQDNATTWLDWASRDLALEDHVAALAGARARWPLVEPGFMLQGDWRDLGGHPMTSGSWAGADGFELRLPAADGSAALRVDRSARSVTIAHVEEVESRP
jgi:glycogen operon protein